MAAAFVLVPVAIQVAWRTRFLDVPQGYKGHAEATPYLGGAAVVGAFALAALVMTGAIEVWHVMAAAVLNGLIFSFNAPGRQALESSLA